MKTEEKIGHYALQLKELKMAEHYAKRHLNLVQTDIKKIEDTIKELKQRGK